MAYQFLANNENYEYCENDGDCYGYDEHCDNCREMQWPLFVRFDFVERCPVFVHFDHFESCDFWTWPEHEMAIDAYYADDDFDNDSLVVADDDDDDDY